ncbi:MAG: hypothetical protein AOA65_1624 [Candidatus Bathyarchaeota archaeon BA1]|nr:MAG: hypothetical protein AOA65_1624 [Candidatus Bathyarchaeota archaeon BA1]
MEIVQFGSSVYMPEHARDLDLLVFTRQRKDYGVYLDATCEAYEELEFPHNIDVVPKEVGEPLNESLAVQVRGAYKILYGSGRYLREATDEALMKLVMELGLNPTFEEARLYIHGVEGAASIFKRLGEARSEAERNNGIRLAFNRLFDAARIASMAYLSTEENRWGRVGGRLPSPYKEEFREITNMLHIKYFYEGNYPRERVEEEFQRWLRKVEDYINRLEAKGAKTAQWSPSTSSSYQASTRHYPLARP